MRRNRRLGCPPFWGPWISGVCWKGSWTHCRLCCPAISSRRCRLRGKPFDRSVLQNSRRLRVVFTFLFTLYPSLCACKNGLLLHSSLNETPLLTDEECGFCREVISAVVALYRSLSRRGVLPVPVGPQPVCAAAGGGVAVCGGAGVDGRGERVFVCLCVCEATVRRSDGGCGGSCGAA